MNRRIVAVLLLVLLSLPLFAPRSWLGFTPRSPSGSSPKAVTGQLPMRTPVDVLTALPSPPPAAGATQATATIDPSSANPALRPEPFYRRMRVAGLGPEFVSAAGSPESAVGARWGFALFPDAHWVGRVSRVEKLGPGRAVFYGELEGVAGSDFIVAIHGRGAAMSFTTPGAGLYQVRTAGPDLLTVIELDPARLPPCGLEVGSAIPSGPNPDPAAARRQAALLTRHAADTAPAGQSYGAQGQQGGDGSGLVFTTVDVMIAYTGAAQAGAGGADGVAALIDLMVARANATFINSRAGLQLRLVRTEAVSYPEPDDIETDLTRLTDTGDGYLDALHTARTSAGADLVTLLTETTGSGAAGLAWLYASGGGSDVYGFSVVQRAGSESTYVHEIGHNFGCEHDRDNTSSDDDDSALYPYAFGYRFTPAGYPQLRTVMAYSPGDGIPYFSNPDVTYLGVPTGVAIGQPGEAHNARVLDNTKAAVAAFRATAGNQPPSVALTYPLSTTPLTARQSLTLEAEAGDTDGTVASVRFYQLMSDGDWFYSNVSSTQLGTDATAPYTQAMTSLDAGYVTYAAVAQDNSGGIGTHTVSVTVNPWYKSTPLPLPVGYTESLDLTAINASGQIAGYVDNAANITRAARWDAAAVTLLELLPGDTESKAHAIADDGTVYGESINGATRRACSWSPSGTITNLSAAIPGQTAVAARGADGSGNVLHEVASGRYYRASTILPLNFKGTHIASNGRVGGYDYTFTAPAHWEAARWTSGNSSTLLPPLATYASSWGWAINRGGAVAGISSPTGGWSTSTSRATYWAAGSTTPVDLGMSGSTASWAAALNDRSDVVGHYTTGSDRPFVWNPALTAPVPLRSVVMPASGMSLSYPRAINEAGVIAVETYDFAQSAYVPVRLTPVAGLANAYWQRTHFNVVQIEGSGVAGDTDDPDGDSIPNLAERAFGLNPKVAESVAGTGYPALAIDGPSGKLTLTFRRLRPPADLTYTVEASSNLLSPWSTSGAEEISRTAVDADWDQVVCRSMAAPAPGTPVFLRVRVSR